MTQIYNNTFKQLEIIPFLVKVKLPDTDYSKREEKVPAVFVQSMILFKRNFLLWILENSSLNNIGNKFWRRSVWRIHIFFNLFPRSNLFLMKQLILLSLFSILSFSLFWVSLNLRNVCCSFTFKIFLFFILS